MGLHWMVSHNLLISNKISLYNDKDNDKYIHSLSGLDLNIFDKNNYDFFLSFDLNKISYYESQTYRWYQMSLIYLAKFRNMKMTNKTDTLKFKPNRLRVGSKKFKNNDKSLHFDGHPFTKTDNVITFDNTFS